MKVKYYKEDDILVIKLSSKPFDYAEMEGNFVVHFSKDRKPVRIEVIDASNLLREPPRALPKSVKEDIFSTA